MADRLFDNIKYLDIAADLTDPVYKGIYKGVKVHEPDLPSVLTRSWKKNIDKIMITGTSLQLSREALHLAKTDQRLFCTVGCHPMNCFEFERYGEEEYYDSLLDLAKLNKDKVKAVGAIGLDYHPKSIEQCDKNTQIKYFEMQFQIAHALRLPVFLHCRHASEDFIKMLEKYEGRLRGVIHSFNGSAKEAKQYEDLGFYFGLTGCSVKTEENLEVVKTLPPHRIVFETDSPRCKIGRSYAGYKYVKTRFPANFKSKWSPERMVRGRSEPSQLMQVLEAVSAVKQFDSEILALIAYQNAEKIYFPRNTAFGDYGVHEPKTRP